MTDNQRLETKNSSAVVLRVPKPDLQIIVLGLIALITLFQTFQLVRISSKAGSASVKTAPAKSDLAPAKSDLAPAANTNSSTGSDADVPQSMVGGC